MKEPSQERRPKERRLSAGRLRRHSAAAELAQIVRHDAPRPDAAGSAAPHFLPGTLLMLLLAAGCSFFSRSKSQFYSLERIPPSAPAATVRGLPVGIDSLVLPPGFDRKEVVARKADHQLDVRSSQQWSASLQDLVLHTLASDLADRVPEGMVILPGAAKPAAASRSIDVVVEEMAAGPESKVVLDSRWVIHEAGRADVAHHESITLDIASLDSTQIAAGFSQALATLADRMAAQL